MRNSGIDGIEDVCLKADYKERKKDYTIKGKRIS